MEINLYRPQELLAVDSYNAEGFVVSGQRFDSAIMLHGTGCQPWDANTSLQMASFAAAADVLAACDVVLLGTGLRAAFLPPSQRAALKALGLLVEVMDTGAACRTYNVLLGDGRKVGALLLPAV